MNKFKVGDKIRCIKYPSSGLQLNWVYTVNAVQDTPNDPIFKQWIGIEEIIIKDFPTNWASDLFTLVSQKMEKPKYVDFLSYLETLNDEKESV